MAMRRRQGRLHRPLPLSNGRGARALSSQQEHGPEHQLIALQRMVGNQVVQRLVAERRIQRHPGAPGHVHDPNAPQRPPPPPPRLRRPPDYPPPPPPGQDVSSQPPSYPPPPVPQGSKPPSYPPPPVPQGSKPPSYPPPPVPQGSKPPSYPPPPVPQGSKPPNRPPPPIPSRSRGGTITGGVAPLSMAGVALTNIADARAEIARAEKYMQFQMKRDFSGLSQKNIVTGAADKTVIGLKGSLVTDALSLVAQFAIAEVKTDKKGRKTPVVKKKHGLIGKKEGKLDEARFAGLTPDIVQGFDDYAKQSDEAKTKAEEYKRLSAEVRATKLKTKGTAGKKEKKFIKKVTGLAAQVAAQEVLMKAAPIQTEADKYRAPAEQAATSATSSVIDNQTQYTLSRLQQHRQFLDVLELSAQMGGLDDHTAMTLSSKAIGVKTQAADNGDQTHVDAITGMATEAADAASDATVDQKIRTKAGENLLKYLSANHTILDALWQDTSAKVDTMLGDPQQRSEMIKEAVSETLEGKMNSSLGSVTSKLGGLAKKPGDSGKFDFIVRVPVDPTASAFVGFEIKGDARRLQNKSLRIAMELNIVGGAKIPGVDVEAMGKLGGYFDVVVEHEGAGMEDEAFKADGKRAGDLLSFAFYRRFRESAIIPDAITNYMWGLGGKSIRAGESKSDAKYREAEAWGAAQEEAMRPGDYVETGLVVGGSAKAKVGTGAGTLGIGGQAQVNTGTRYTKKFIEERRAKGAGKQGTGLFGRGQKSIGRGTTTLSASADAAIGPLKAGAGYTGTFFDSPPEGEDRHIASTLRVHAEGMVMKKAMMGDPAEAAARLGGWIAEAGLLAKKAINIAEKDDQALYDKKKEKGLVRPGKDEIMTMKKGGTLSSEIGKVIGTNRPGFPGEVDAAASVVRGDAGEPGAKPQLRRGRRHLRARAGEYRERRVPREPGVRAKRKKHPRRVPAGWTATRRGLQQPRRGDHRHEPGAVHAADPAGHPQHDDTPHGPEPDGLRAARDEADQGAQRGAAR